MNFNSHLDLEGKHAFLSASKYHWINYDEDKLIESYSNWRATQRGTELHEYAANSIRLGIKLARSKRTLNQYVNDAIGYRMQPEVVLYYTSNCFGTADSISFDGKLLRIHDLKTGVTHTSEHQVEIYAAIFCLEYQISPKNIEMELRIYQNDDVRIWHPEVDDILAIMDTIVRFDERIEKLKRGD